MEDFRKQWSRMKINEEVQTKQSYHPRTKTIFKLISKNQSVVYAN